MFDKYIITICHPFTISNILSFQQMMASNILLVYSTKD